MSFDSTAKSFAGLVGSLPGRSPEALRLEIGMAATRIEASMASRRGAHACIAVALGLVNGSIPDDRNVFEPLVGTFAATSRLDGSSR